MAPNPVRKHRRSIRLPNFDYRQNAAYVVTICTQNRDCLFGEVVGLEMKLNDYGKIVEEEWYQTMVLRPYVIGDVFIVMPNHFHVILILEPGEPVGAQRAVPLRAFGTSVPGSLSTVVGGFKSAVTKRINQRRGTLHAPVWQRNFYERVIRNEAELQKFRDYIINNPQKWTFDRYYSDRTSP